MPAPRRRLSLGGMIAAAIGIIIMVLTGTCTLSVIGDPDPYLGDVSDIALVVGGIPFLIGLVIFVLALIYGRRP